MDQWAMDALLFVAGKGGSGKTTLAAALGLFLSKSRRCLVLSSDGDSLARLVGTVLEREPMELDWAPGLWVGRLQLWEALEDFGRLRLGNSRIVKALIRSRSVRGLLDALPGLAGLAMLGRAWHHCRASSSRGGFDTVILEVSGRGHLGRLLGQPARMAAVLPFGPLKKDLDELTEVLSDDSRSKLVAVTRPEDYSVSETLELVEEVERHQRRFDLLVVNGLWPEWLASCAPGLGLDLSADRLGRFGARRLAAQKAALVALQNRDLDMVHLPFVSPLASPRERLTSLAEALGGDAGPTR